MMRIPQSERSISEEGNCLATGETNALRSPRHLQGCLRSRVLRSPGNPRREGAWLERASSCLSLINTGAGRTLPSSTGCQVEALDGVFLSQRVDGCIYR